MDQDAVAPDPESVADGRITVYLVCPGNGAPVTLVIELVHGEDFVVLAKEIDAIAGHHEIVRYQDYAHLSSGCGVLPHTR